MPVTGTPASATQTQSAAPSTEGEGQTGVPLYASFDAMGLSEKVLRGVYSYGWEEPTHIQQQATVPIIHGHDVIAQASAGRGKTGAFSIGSLQILDVDNHNPQVLILAPTRELAGQIHTVIAEISTWMEGVEAKLCVGGTKVYDDKQEFRQKRPQVVIGTPGRVLHLLSEDRYGNPGPFRPSHLKLIVLDEADEMLSKGFADVMEEIFARVPQDIQVALFSATMPAECLQLSQQFMRNPVEILVQAEKLHVEALAQFYVNVESERNKYATILDLYDCVSVSKVIIFCNRKSTIDRLAAQMNADDFTTSCIHGDLSPEMRKLRMTEFRSGASRVLLATDLIGRGIDVSDVGLVLNYDLPSGHDYAEKYLHRVGRSARHGKQGVAINLITNDRRDTGIINGIQDHYSISISELPADLAACGLT